MSDSTLVLRIPAIAQALGTTEAAVRSLIQRDELPVRRLGRRVFMTPADLQDYLTAKQQP